MDLQKANNLLQDIEKKIVELRMLFGQTPTIHQVLTKNPEYDDALTAYGQEWIFQELINSPKNSDQSRAFVGSVAEGFKKYGRVTPKQHEALAKNYWHCFVKSND